MKYFEKETYFRCPVCGTRTLWHVIEASQEANHACVKCNGYFLITDDGALGDEEEAEFNKRFTTIKVTK